nr:MAG TPA: hypothetical protein [Bacteriophage sp.]
MCLRPIRGAPTPFEDWSFFVPFDSLSIYRTYVLVNIYSNIRSVFSTLFLPLYSISYYIPCPINRTRLFFSMQLSPSVRVFFKPLPDQVQAE